MGRMFYDLEETALRLRKLKKEIKKMVSLGQLDSFRDRDKMLFKVDQVENLAGPNGIQPDWQDMIKMASRIAEARCFLVRAVGLDSWTLKSLETGRNLGLKALSYEEALIQANKRLPEIK